MIKRIRNIECYCPQYIGKKDIWIACDKIYKIVDPMDCLYDSHIETVIEGNGLIAFPGIIDGHVHVIGGGGEDGFGSRVDEIKAHDILKAGVTSLVGLLGADDRTKSLVGLLAKAKALESEGITTFLYTGSYAVPPVTFTSDIAQDMVLIDKVIGVGEIAISDHRSSHPGLAQLLDVATKAHLGGLLTGKAGIVHLHIGDGKAGLKPLCELVEKSDLPPGQFLPTHVNRSARLFEEAIQYCYSGGYIDLTAGEDSGISVPDAIQALMDEEAAMDRVTISSDANGSIPAGGVGRIQWLYDDVIRCIVDKKLEPEAAFSLVTRNVAKRIRQFPRKGSLTEGSDADLILLDDHYRLRMVVCKGEVMEV